MNNYHYPPKSRPVSNLKVFKTGCLVLAGFFVICLAGFFMVFRFLMKSSDEYESTFTELTGVFESEEGIAGPISGGRATVAYFTLDQSFGSTGPGRGYRNDDDAFLYYKKGTTFHAKGRKYILTGTQPHRFYGKVRYDYHTQQVRIYAIDERKRRHDSIPACILGLDRKLDECLRKIREYEFRGTSTTLTVREHLYSNRDTVTMRVHVRNDTIFLGDSKY